MTEQAAPAPAPQGTSRVSQLFHHKPSGRLHELHSSEPVQIEQVHVGFNGKVALIITAIVGTMWAAYLFTGLALISLPSSLASHDLIIIVQWIAQTFLQLVLLPVIIVGQNIQGRAADKRAIETYKDAEAILHECMQLQEHLQAQDRILDDLVTRLQKVPGLSA